MAYGGGQKPPNSIMGVKIIDKKPDKGEIQKGAIKKLFEMDKKELMTVVEDEDYWKMMKQLRTDYESNRGFSKERGLRHVARIPAKLYYQALEIWGEEVFTDKNKFKKAFARDEIGEWTLLVPKNTL